ncbi:MAG: Cof-type HAD-IIB family hydrolase [Prevotella sp.]|nr:Cof-type HAD-IIB family hydrolase [Prevotella sp.]
MDRYALFFDIDGTLVSFETHEIPASTIFALTQAKANGHRVYIATGRPLPIITNLGAIEHLVDGYMTTNGAYCFVGKKTVCMSPIEKKDVDYVLADAVRNDYACIVSSETEFVVFNPKEYVDRIFRRQLAVEKLDLAKPVDHALSEKILQLSPFFSEKHEQELMSRLPDCVSGRWHPEFTDITSRLADKGIGLASIAKYEGFDLQHTIAFGDGGNDLSMIRRAGVGVAMGNALESVKSAADYTTTSVDEEGIRRALEHFNII